MSDHIRRAAELRTTQRVAARISELRAYARDERAVVADIDVTASRRLRLYRQLAERHSAATVDLIGDLSRQLDFLYEELRITRMVTA